MSEQANERVGIGISSVLLILVVLSMTTLSVLALLSARSDHELSMRRQTYITAMQDAAGRYQQTLFELNEAENPREAAMPQGVSADWTDDATCNLSIPFFDAMALKATVAITPDGVNEVLYCVANTGEWQLDQLIELFQQ